MKYSLQNYAEALAAAIDEVGPSRRDIIIQNFLAMLKKSGDEVHAEKIVSAAEHILRRGDNGREILFESARPLAHPSRGSLLGIVGTKDVIVEHINPDLIAGVRIVVDGEREFDGSLKGKLDKMFREI